LRQTHREIRVFIHADGGVAQDGISLHPHDELIFSLSPAQENGSVPNPARHIELQFIAIGRMLMGGVTSNQSGLGHRFDLGSFVGKGWSRLNQSSGTTAL
jgi:hypothetical protein